MKKGLTAEIGVFWINTICTLKCKRCITMTPYHKKPMNFPFENISGDIDRFFEIYDWIDHFDLEGGETLLHPDVHKIIDKAYEYSNRFTRLHILTNGTMLPSEAVIKSCKGRDIFFIIDDYGSLSNQRDQLIQILEDNKIAYRVDKYHGEDQYYNGWVDFGNMKYKEYSNEQLGRVFSVCRQAQIRAPYIKDGKIFVCSIQAAGIHYIPLGKGEYVDLRDDSTIEERIEVANNFGKNPLKSCQYCQGFDAQEGERFPAAEQIVDLIEDHQKICF